MDKYVQLYESCHRCLDCDGCLAMSVSVAYIGKISNFSLTSHGLRPWSCPQERSTWVFFWISSEKLTTLGHDDVIKWKHFPQYWPFARGIHRSPVNSPPVTRSFDVFFDLRPNKRLSKQSWGWWFKTPTRPLWRQSYDRDAPLMTIVA